jgi:hypothetical protein
MQQTHCYATELLRYYGNAIKVHRSCHQGNPTCNDMFTAYSIPTHPPSFNIRILVAEEYKVLN